MRVSEAINSRRSMRVFKPDPVSRADVEWIIANATRAASNGNLQPWKLYVTMGKARQRLSSAIVAQRRLNARRADGTRTKADPVWSERAALRGPDAILRLGVGYHVIETRGSTSKFERRG